MHDFSMYYEHFFITFFVIIWYNNKKDCYWVYNYQEVNEMSELWYRGESRCWEEALPIGNGRIGGMIFGNAYYDKISLNEETLWSGSPERPDVTYSMEKVEKIRSLIRERKYAQADKKISNMLAGEYSAAYLSPGDIIIEFNNSGDGDFKNHRRSLNLDNALCRTHTELKDMNFKDFIPNDREYFVSGADDVMVFKIKSGYEYMSFTIRFAPRLDIKIRHIGDEIIAEGHCLKNTDDEDFKRTESIPFMIIIKIISKGRVCARGMETEVTGNSEAVVLVSVATGFNGYDKMPESEGKDYKKICREKLKSALGYSYNELRKRHIAEYRKLYTRCELELDGDDFCHMPTDERLQRIREGGSDNKLVQMLFDYGKYLLISSSREGGQPANLQGIWTKKLISEWRANYTTNINTQMNYWPVEVVGLSECHMPLLNMVKELSQKGNHYGLRGWLCCHNSDIWRFNREAAKHCVDYWHVGGLWLCRHIYEHYCYTQDIEFLKEYMPVLEGAFEFFEDWLVEDDGYLTTMPSISPENSFIFENETVSAAKGSTMDISVIKDFLLNIIELGNVLGKSVERYKKMLDKLPPFRVGSDGRLLEWCEEFEESERHHRHVSHLFGIYPACIIDEDSEFFEAAKKSLAARLEDDNVKVGWFNAWVTNIYARFKDGEKALERIKYMLKNCVYKNLLDGHPPFQIDGNSGIVAAIAEMLIQSHKGKIELIPAIPAEWKSGSVKGIRARGGYCVDFKWSNNKITHYKIYDKGGNDVSDKILVLNSGK